MNILNTSIRLRSSNGCQRQNIAEVGDFEIQMFNLAMQFNILPNGFALALLDHGFGGTTNVKGDNKVQTRLIRQVRCSPQSRLASEKLTGLMCESVRGRKERHRSLIKRLNFVP